MLEPTPPLPSATEALSGLSPFIHFGQLSAQRAALEARKHRGKHKVGQKVLWVGDLIWVGLFKGLCRLSWRVSEMRCTGSWELCVFWGATAGPSTSSIISPSTSTPGLKCRSPWIASLRNSSYGGS